MIINYLERYFYIICFATYVRQNANAGFEKTFVNWLDEHKVLTIEEHPFSNPIQSRSFDQ